jgi:AcrR family transcriptional regulator
MSERGAHTVSRDGDEQVRQRILDAAFALFAKGGESHVTIRRIARAVDYSPSAIYLYFDSKDDILRRLLFMAFQEFLRQEPGWVQGNTPGQRLRSAARGYLEFARSNPHYYHLMFVTSATRQVSYDKESPPRQSFDRLKGMVADCLGDPSDAEAEAAALSVWGALHGLALLVNSGRAARVVDDPDKTLEMSLGFLPGVE